MVFDKAPRAFAHFLLDGDTIEIPIDGGSDDPVESLLVTEQGQAWLLAPWRQDGTHGGTASTGAILSPMPGKIIAVEVTEGQTVVKGQKLLTLKGLKLLHERNGS